MNSEFRNVFSVLIFFVLISGPGIANKAGRGPANEGQVVALGWEQSPDDPGTMICWTAGIYDWVVETGSAARPASGAALLPGKGYLNKLAVGLTGVGTDVRGAPVAYAPHGTGVVEGRTRRELVFPSLSLSGLRVFRRFYVAEDGAARWLDIFVNEGPAEIEFQAVLESEALPGAMMSFRGPERSPAGGEWFVTPASGLEPWLAHVNLGAEHRLELFSSENSAGCLRRVYEIRLGPGETACLLSLILPAATEKEAAFLGRETVCHPTGRSAWLSPREKLAVRNFNLEAVSASGAPGIQLNTRSSSICWGISSVQVEAWDDIQVVWMEISYWEDWDLPSGHRWFEHPLYSSDMTGRQLKYNFCWDIPNSPRHSGGNWRLEGTAWDDEGQSGSFFTSWFVPVPNCPATCASWVVSVSFPNLADGQLIWGIHPVQVEAKASAGLARVELFIDGSSAADWQPGSFPTHYIGNYDWDTLNLEIHSQHTLRAVVHDRNNQQVSTDIQVEVTCVSIALTGQILFGRLVILEMNVSNPDDLPVARFTLYRKFGTSDFRALGTIPASSLLNGHRVVMDGLPWNKKTAVYRVEAESDEGRVIGRSEDMVFFR